MKLSKFFKENAEKLNINTEDFDFEAFDKYEVNIDEGMINYDTYVRRPYYRLRGKPVTEDQAFEVIRRTDKFFSWEMNLDISEEYVGSFHINNWWLNRNHFPSAYGWIHPEGILGGNGITDKYPNFEELFFEMLDLMQAFPYLDFVLAITNWNEISDECWEHYNDEEYDEIRLLEKYEGFNEAIEIVFWVHDNQIDVLNKENGVKKYNEYVKKYEVEDPSYYTAHYNNINQTIPCGVDYLKRCIEAYGLNAEEELNKLSEYVWNPDYKR